MMDTPPILNNYAFIILEQNLFFQDLLLEIRRKYGTMRDDIMFAANQAKSI